MLSLSAFESLVVAFIVGSCWVLWTCALSPLARIPSAHPSSPFSSLWILWTRFRGHEVFLVSAAHERHGPVIRLGPREVSINTADKSIHILHNKKVEKSPWYSFFSNYGVTNTMSSLGDQVHSSRRKRVSHVYSKSWLQHSAHMRQCISKILRARLLPLLFQESEKRKPTNVLPLSLALGLDMVGAYFFGLNVAPNFVQNQAERDEWLEAYAKSHEHDLMFWTQEISASSPILQRLKGMLTSRSSVAEKMTTKLNEWCLSQCALANAELSRPEAAGEYPEVYAHLKSAIDKERIFGLSKYTETEVRLEIASELLDHIVATRDAFGVTLAKAFYEVSRSSSIQQSLRSELQSLKLSQLQEHNERSSEKSLSELPILNGIIKEALRLRPTHPEGQPRITPYGGITICNQFIPSGVRVNSYPYLLHRIDSTFAQPDDFMPERWVKCDEEKGQFDLQAQEKNFWAFGRGPRICLGSHLVVHLMQHILATIYTNFETTVHNDSDWGKHGGFVSGASDEALWLNFRSIE